MGATRLCLLLFFFFLASVSSVRRFTYITKPNNVRKLNNIDDLRNTDYANAPPRHGRMLLFWFAQQVRFNQNNNMYLNFDPRDGYYGFHWYGNREGDLPPLNSEESYYSVGNLNGPGARDLPDYVHRNYRNNRGPEGNMDRLMVVLNQRRSNRIVRVYITAHNRNRRDFNPADTYEIDPHLISHIREHYCRNYFVYYNIHRCRLFLLDSGYNSNYCFLNRGKRSSDSQLNADDKIELQIKTTEQGYAKLTWDNIPDYLIEKESGDLGTNLYIDIYQNIYSSDPNEDMKWERKQYFNINQSSGASDTSILINAGLQPQLRLKGLYPKNVFWYGTEFDGANKVLPIRIRGNDASLQLIAKDGKACAQLYIKKTFSNWKTVLTNSWVGFYKSSLDGNKDYYTYQNAREFVMIDSTTTGDHNTYQYKSSLSIAPGVQIRFLLENNYDNVLAKTTPWEIDEESVCNDEMHLPELSSSWFFPEFFYEPDFYDANNIVPVKIAQYNAGLQLITKEGKACARLYIKKSFTYWKEMFKDSWVGFYKSYQKSDKKYEEYQNVVDFEKMKDGTDNFDIYQYKSSLVIAPGVQIRFFQNQGYDYKLLIQSWMSD